MPETEIVRSTDDKIILSLTLREAELLRQVLETIDPYDLAEEAENFASDLSEDLRISGVQL